MSKIGLVAGRGKLPITFAENARAKGEVVVGLGIKGLTDEALAASVDKMHWFEWGSLQKAVLVVLMEGVRRIVMLGKIEKALAFEKNAALDDAAKKIFSGIGGRKDYAIMGEVEKMLKKIGIAVIDPTPYLTELLPSPGTLTKRSPTAKELADIHYGKDIAAAMAGYDVGQTVAVKDKTVIAVEAVEGTDETIRRAGALVRDGLVAVKMARPNQDMRFDVPLVGPDTVRALIDAKGTALALQSGKMYIGDRDEVIRLANDNGIAIVVM